MCLFSVVARHESRTSGGTRRRRAKAQDASGDAPSNESNRRFARNAAAGEAIPKRLESRAGLDHALQIEEIESANPSHELSVARAKARRGDDSIRTANAGQRGRGRESDDALACELWWGRPRWRRARVHVELCDMAPTCASDELAIVRNRSIKRL
jgi:hypothetical protein